MLNGQYSQGAVNPQNPYGRPNVYQQWSPPNPLHPMNNGRQPPYVQPPYHLDQQQQQAQQSQQGQQAGHQSPSQVHMQPAAVYQYNNYQQGQPVQPIQQGQQQGGQQQQQQQRGQQSGQQGGQHNSRLNNSWQQPPAGNAGFIVPDSSGYNTGNVTSAPSNQTLFDSSGIRPGMYATNSNGSSGRSQTTNSSYSGYNNGAVDSNNNPSHYVNPQYYNVNSTADAAAGYYNQISLPPPHGAVGNVPPHMGPGGLQQARGGKQGFEDMGRMRRDMDMSQQQQVQQQQQQQAQQQQQQVQQQQVQQQQIQQVQQGQQQQVQQGQKQQGQQVQSNLTQHQSQQVLHQNILTQQRPQQHMSQAPQQGRMPHQVLPGSLQHEQEKLSVQNIAPQSASKTDLTRLHSTVEESNGDGSKPATKKPRKSRKSAKKQDIASTSMDTSGLSQQQSQQSQQQQQTSSSTGGSAVTAKPKGENSDSSGDRDSVPPQPVIGATEVDHLMLIIQAQEKHTEKLRRGEVNEPFKLDNELKLVPSTGSLNGGVGKRSSDNVLKYKCTFPDCNKSFSQKTHLEIHGRSHTGERPYVCDFEGCTKRFSQRGNLRTHRRSHTGEKPYTCDICGKQFAQRGNYRAHKLIHENYRPYECKLDRCNKTFTQLGNLKAHQNKFHQDTVNSLTQKLKYYGMNQMNMIPAEEMDLVKYFAELYKNSNRGIKGRGKDGKIIRSDGDELSSKKSMSQSPGAPPPQQLPNKQASSGSSNQYQYPPGSIQGSNQMLGQTLFQGDNSNPSLQFQMSY